MQSTEETDVVFFINSAMNVTGRSLYSNDVRWEQTQETILSIDKYVPNSIKYMIDGSFLPIEEYKIESHGYRITSFAFHAPLGAAYSFGYYHFQRIYCPKEKPGILGNGSEIIPLYHGVCSSSAGNRTHAVYGEPVHARC